MTKYLIRPSTCQTQGYFVQGSYAF